MDWKKKSEVCYGGEGWKSVASDTPWKKLVYSTSKSPSLPSLCFFFFYEYTFFHNFGAVERSPCNIQCCSKKDLQQSAVDCWASWCNVTW